MPFTVIWKSALLAVKKNTCSETRHTFVFALTVKVSRAAKTTCFPQRNEETCCMRRSNARTRTCWDGALPFAASRRFGAWQAPSISKSSAAVVRHCALGVDPLWALCPCETRVFDSRCGCVDRKRLHQCGCVASHPQHVFDPRNTLIRPQ